MPGERIGLHGRLGVRAGLVEDLLGLGQGVALGLLAVADEAHDAGG
mgnify:CR=1 FL=1